MRKICHSWDIFNGERKKQLQLAVITEAAYWFIYLARSLVTLPTKGKAQLLVERAPRMLPSNTLLLPGIPVAETMESRCPTHRRRELPYHLLWSSPQEAVLPATLQSPTQGQSVLQRGGGASPVTLWLWSVTAYVLSCLSRSHALERGTLPPEDKECNSNPAV